MRTLLDAILWLEYRYRAARRSYDIQNVLQAPCLINIPPRNSKLAGSPCRFFTGSFSPVSSRSATAPVVPCRGAAPASSLAKWLPDKTSR